MKLSSSKLTRHKEQEKSDKAVLFVCVENAGRSQMAEGFFRKYAPRGYTTLSAGTKASCRLLLAPNVKVLIGTNLKETSNNCYISCSS